MDFLAITYVPRIIFMLFYLSDTVLSTGSIRGNVELLLTVVPYCMANFTTVTTKIVTCITTSHDVLSGSCQS